MPYPRLSLVAALWLAAAPAFAQVADTQPAQRVSYDAAFFAAFAPRNALDMIRQTPGFAFEDNEDDSQRRGFAGAVGNVLIDGERLSAKSQSLTDVLQRIPAADVLRIEILRGAEVAGDASGAAVIANIIRTRSAGSGTWDVGFEMTNAKEPAPGANFAWSGRQGSIDYSIGAELYSHDHENPGSRRRVDGSGDLVALRYSEFPHQNRDYLLNGEVSLPAGGGKLTATGQAAYTKFHEESALLTTDASGVQIEDEFNPAAEDVRTGEAGVTWLRGFSDWELSLTGLATRKEDVLHVRSVHFDAADVRDGEVSLLQTRDSGETILRGTLWRPLDSGRIEFGVEAAENTLEGSLELTEDLGAGPVPVIVPNANLEVEERRAEAFASHVWNISSNWSFDSRLAAETSRLEFHGDTEQSVSLTYLKPRVQLTRKLGAHQVQARLFRDVGQLDFNDFVSSAQLADDLINGGNPDLKPQTAWAAEVEVDLRLPREAALRVRLFRHWLDDVEDLVPLGPPGQQFDSPGNIGEGDLLGAQVNLRLPLDPLVRGGTFTLTSLMQDSNVRDPLTGRDREISDLFRNTFKAEFRQDLNAWKLAWGVSYWAQSSKANYRLAEVDEYRDITNLEAFVETTVIPGIKIRLRGFGLLDDSEYRRRTFYSPDRNGTVILRETAAGLPGTWFQLGVSGRF
jgi:hypothetical protein